MPLSTLLISTLEQRGIDRLHEVAPDIDASVYGSAMVGIIRSVASAIHPVTMLAQDVLNDAFPQTALGGALDEFGIEESLPRNPASASIGMLNIFGNDGDVVPLQTEFIAENTTIATIYPAIIVSQTISLTGLSCAAGVATASSATPHNLGTGATVNVLFGDARVDGAVQITGTTDSTFSFSINDKNTFSLGAGTASGFWVNVNAKSTDVGESQNIIGQTDLSGSFEAYLVNGMSGGAEQESDPLYSQRIIERRNLLEGVFTAAQVISAALMVSGNTRAWVVSPQYGVVGGNSGAVGYLPLAGQVCVYVVRDNDISITPSDAVLALTKQSIVDNGKKPCHTIDDDIFVFAPKLKPIVFAIQSLNPDTPDMRRAIESSLKSYMEDQVDFQDEFTDKQQIAVIATTKDSSGNRPIDFDLLNGTQIAAAGEILIYGGVASWT